ncbi:unnamed protein product [Phaeothamnion confervicola]
MPVWRLRNCVHFKVGRTRPRVFPVIIHLLKEDLAWFNEEAESLWEELRQLLRDEVIRPSALTAGDEDKDPEGDRSHKRARKEDPRVNGRNLHFTWRYRPQTPCFTVLEYQKNSATDAPKSPAKGTIGRSNASSGSGGGKLKRGKSRGAAEVEAAGPPEFTALPMSRSSLLVWVSRGASPPHAMYGSRPLTCYFGDSARVSAALRQAAEAAKRVEHGGGEGDDLELAIALSLSEARGGADGRSGSSGGGGGGSSSGGGGSSVTAGGRSGAAAAAAAASKAPGRRSRYLDDDED